MQKYYVSSSGQAFAHSSVRLPRAALLLERGRDPLQRRLRPRRDEADAALEWLAVERHGVAVEEIVWAASPQEAVERVARHYEDRCLELAAGVLADALRRDTSLEHAANDASAAIWREFGKAMQPYADEVRDRIGPRRSMTAKGAEIAGLALGTVFPMGGAWDLVMDRSARWVDGDRWRTLWRAFEASRGRRAKPWTAAQRRLWATAFGQFSLLPAGRAGDLSLDWVDAVTGIAVYQHAAKCREVMAIGAEAFAAGAWLYWVCGSEIVVVPRPRLWSEAHEFVVPQGWGPGRRVARQRLHREDGPAVDIGGFEVSWWWHGVEVHERFICEPDNLSAADVDARGLNAEVRRVTMERIGPERYLQQVDAELIDEDPEWGKLWRARVRGNEPLVMVEVVNSTPEPDGTFRDYYLRVPPTMRSARHAVAWTFEEIPQQFELEVQT